MRIFAAQLVTLLVDALWVGGLACILLWGLRLGRALRVSVTRTQHTRDKNKDDTRVSVEVEAVGVDIPKHGGATYRPRGHAQLVMARVHVPSRTESPMDARWVHRAP